MKVDPHRWCHPGTNGLHQCAIANPIEWADDISDAWDDDWDDDDFTDAASGLRGAEGDSDED